VVFMKRVAVVIAVVAVLAMAGSALAWHGKGPGGMARGVFPERMAQAPGCGGCGGCGYGNLSMGPGRGPGGFRAGALAGAPQLPAELQAKVQEMRKFRLQLQLLMMEDKVDEAKAREIFQKVQGLRNEMAEWHFNEMMKSNPKAAPQS